MSEIPLYRAPFPPEVTQVLFFRNRDEADAIKIKLGESNSVETTFPPADYKWNRADYIYFAMVEFIAFCVADGDNDFLKFAEDAAPKVSGFLMHKPGRPVARKVKIAQFPPGNVIADLSIEKIVEFIRTVDDYQAPDDENENRDNAEGEDDFESDAGEDTDSDAPAEGGKLAHQKRKKITSIKSYRQWCKKNDRKAYTFVGSWVKAAIESGELSINEIGAMSICKVFMSSPFALECWPGEKAVLKCMSSAKTTWLRNRDSLEKKGWIIVEKFGSGTSPIIFPCIPGKKCPSKFAPKEPGPDYDDTS